MFFASPRTLEELKQQYRELSFKYHPDKGGDTATMQAINAEYEQLFGRLKDIHCAADGEMYKAAAPTDETADQFIHVVDVLMRLDGVIIEICGRFVWLSGNTKVYKDIIKDLGFRWSINKTAWYLAPQGYRRRSRRDWTMADIRGRFGSAAMMSAGSVKVEDSVAA